MPISFLSEAEHLRFNSFPNDLSTNDLIVWFTLSDNDLLQIPKTITPANRLGFALRILLLQFLDFHLTDLTLIPVNVVDFVATQIKTDANQIKFYAERGATRTVHQRAIEEYLGFSLPTEQDLNEVSVWLLERALEHDRPTLLLQLLCEQFLVGKLVRPGFSVLERMIATARNAAETQLFKRVESIIDEVLAEDLDRLLQAEEPNLPTPIAWLRQSATSNSPKTVLNGLQKLQKLQKWKVDDWNLSSINPNRRKQLANIGFR